MERVLSRARLLSMLLAAVLFVGTSARADMSVIGIPPGGSDPQYDRFGGGGFLFNGLDFSGVGLSGVYRGTMISPIHFLTAAHNTPLVGTDIDFAFGNTYDPLIPSTFERHNVSNVVRVAGTDLALGTLDGPVSSQIAIYPILYLNNEASYANLPILPVGLAQGNAGQRVGLNTIEPFSPTPIFTADDGIGGIGPGFAWDQEAVGGSAFLVGGDSGGPSFAIVNGQLVVVGIHWAIDDTGTYSIDTFVPALIGDLNALMGPSFSVTVAVPEPGTVVLAGLGIGLLAWRIRRARANRVRVSAPPGSALSCAS